LHAYNYWLTLAEPQWSTVTKNELNYSNIIYYSTPLKNTIESLDNIDPEIKKTYDKLGIPLNEQKRLAGVAIDAVFDSVSVVTTFQKKLEELGIIFGSISTSTQKYPILIKKYLGSVVTYSDNYFTALNSAVFSDGSFCYIPKNVKCPVDLSTYFRINGILTGQFERTLLIGDSNSYVNYLEGCTAPIRNNNQLHAAVVELIVSHNASIHYATVQNWYPGDITGIGGIYNFVTKRGLCLGTNSCITWTQVETGSAITWKYPSIVLYGKSSLGSFYSLSITNNKQQADTGTKIFHIGENTTSTILAKGVSSGTSLNTYRGLVNIHTNAKNSKNNSQCDSILLSNNCKSFTLPTIKVCNNTSTADHEATTSKINEEMLIYCRQRGIEENKAVALIINGFCKKVLNKLPLEFAIEAKKLLDIKIEGAIG
jgi:Fe-S cluster assembly protein SufB